jgi:tRNA 2-thiouridine synthesizing protein A
MDESRCDVAAGARAVLCVRPVLSSKPMTATPLDLSGLKCPLPALKTRKALKGLRPGDRLVVTCTDPMAAIDIPNLLRETGDVLEEQTGSGATLVFSICKAGPDGRADEA